MNLAIARMMKGMIVLKRRCRDQGAFTILEVLVALSLFGVVSLTAFATFNASFRGLLAGRDSSDEQQNARLALEWMTRRVRMAGVGAPAGTVEFITEADTNAVAFRADVDRDGTAEWHCFCLETTQGVLREDITTTGAPASSCTTATGSPITSRGLRPIRVVTLTFAYFRGDEVALTSLPLSATDRSLVRRVRITLSLDSNRSGASDGQDLTFTMDTVLRN